MLFILINTIIIYLTKTPFTIGLILLIQTSLISVTSGILNIRFWYSYIIFLIFLGRLLIIFIYVSRLISNVKFLFNKWIIINIVIIILIFILIINYNKVNSILEDTIKFSYIEINKNLLTKISLNKLFNKPNFIISFIIINYLFITLIIVVKISNINLGSLRKTF